MGRTFEITKQEFKIWRHFYTNVLLVILFCLRLGFLPFGTPMLCYMVFAYNAEGIIPVLSTCTYMFVGLLIVCSPLLCAAAIYEKIRLPIRIELTENFLVLNNKKGNQWTIPCSKCRCTTAFVHCLFSEGFFKGVWTSGITIDVPRELLKGFLRGLYDTGGNAPVDISLYLPVESKYIPEIVFFLEKQNCKQILPPTSRQLLTFFFAPALFVWIHFGEW